MKGTANKETGGVAHGGWGYLWLIDFYHQLGECSCCKQRASLRAAERRQVCVTGVNPVAQATQYPGTVSVCAVATTELSSLLRATYTRVSQLPSYIQTCMLY